jgi:hypothetical protein
VHRPARLYRQNPPGHQQAALWALESGASASLSMLEIVLAIVIAGLLLINGDKLWDGADWPSASWAVPRQTNCPR